MRPAEEARPVYMLDERLYVNLTSRCPLRCRFCFKFQDRPDFFGHELLMREEDEPDMRRVEREIRAAPPHRELVFCGLGEPLERLPAVEWLSRRYKQRGGGRVRVNTCGLYLTHGDEAHLLKLARWVDCLAISLNAPDAAAYEAVCRPKDPRAFDTLLEFVGIARESFPSVLLTAVSYPGVDLDACRALAHKLGLPLGVRPYVPSASEPGATRPPVTQV